MTRRARAANRLYSGSVQIGWRIARWPWERPEWRSRAARLGVQAVGVGALLAAADAQPRIMEYLAGGWLIAAWRAGNREEAEDEQQAATEEAREMLLDEVYLRLLVRLIGDEPGIHLDTLAPELERADDRWRGVTREQIRELLDHLRVPVRRSLRVGPRTGRAGVHRDDARQALRAYLSRDPSPEE